MELQNSHEVGKSIVSNINIEGLGEWHSRTVRPQVTACCAQAIERGITPNEFHPKD